MKQPEYHEGPEARKVFDDGMTKLFQAKKPTAIKDKPGHKKKKGVKDDKSH